MKKLLLLATAAFVAMLILAPTALGQATVETTREETLVTSGGFVSPSVLLPAAALLVGSGIVGYALVRRR